MLTVMVTARQELPHYWRSFIPLLAQVTADAAEIAGHKDPSSLHLNYLSLATLEPAHIDTPPSSTADATEVFGPRPSP